MSKEAMIQDGVKELRSGIRLHKKIRCPRHYMLKPGGIPFVMIRKPSLKNIKDADCKRFGLNPYMPKKDKFGNKIQNFSDYYQPEISAAEARLRIYSEQSIICQGCKRCIIG